MATICDLCSKASRNEKVCSNCGAPIISDDECAALPSGHTWGWATFNFDALDYPLKVEALKDLHQNWKSLEDFTVLRLLTSQAFRFSENARNIKVLIREDFLFSVWQKILEKYPTADMKFRPIGLFESADDLNRLLVEEWGK